jgi:hypothetical protein
MDTDNLALQERPVPLNTVSVRGADDVLGQRCDEQRYDRMCAEVAITAVLSLL